MAVNNKAYFNYHISDQFTAGMVLVGSEVKALIEGKIGFNNAYVYIKDGELYVKNLYIGDFNLAQEPHDNYRERKLLLNKPEIKKCQEWVRIVGNTIVPLQLKKVNNRFKLEIGLAKGKKNHDKREAIKLKDLERENKRKF